ncbi:MAG: hypothetical protein AB1634_08200, partial [Thermodesulfobacteriota bacterium]
RAIVGGIIAGVVSDENGDTFFAGFMYGANVGVMAYMYNDANPKHKAEELLKKALDTAGCVEAIRDAVSCGIDEHELLSKLEKLPQWCEDIIDYCTGVAIDKPMPFPSGICEKFNAPSCSAWILSCEGPTVLDAYLANPVQCSYHIFTVFRECRTVP